MVARDIDDAVILGAGADWRWSYGASDPGQAFTYVFSAQEPTTSLTANIEVDPWWLTTDIQASSGAVAPDNVKNCSSSGATWGGWALWLALLALIRRTRDTDAAI